MPKVLIADDNSNIQKMVAAALQENGIEVVSVGNGEAAVRRMADLNPDLVLADIFMPVRNGYEVCEFVKKHERFSQVPVVLLVGAFDPLDEKEARRVGADGILKKPFVPPDPLIETVISILQKNPRAAAELAAFKNGESSKDDLEPNMLQVRDSQAKSEVPFRPQMPFKIEPKTLPEFPEPSGEEAALAYGSGPGRRTLGGDEPAVKDEVPKAVDASEEFDESSTSRDWRRSAMDFQVPAESANTPAFSSDANLEQVAFPPASVVLADDDRASREVAKTEPVHGEQLPVVQKSESEARDAAAAESSSEPEQSIAPEPAHWMDFMTPGAEHRADDLAAAPIDRRIEAAADESAAAPSLPASSDSLSAEEESSSSHKQESGESWFAPPPAVLDAVANASLGSSRAAIDEDADISLIAGKILEPLLLDDAPQEPLRHGELLRDSASSHSFFAPSSNDPALSETPAEARSEHGGERIPTAPPPNREALAGIPFLTPPRGFDPNALGADEETVETIVQKVLERLEPQLHDLLSQDVLRPMVENLLHSELSKKEK